MKNSSSNDWLIPLLAAFAIYLPLSSTAPSADQQLSAQPQSQALIQVLPVPTPTPTLGRGRVPGEAARLLCDFFGFEPDYDQNAELNPREKSEVENRRSDYCRIKTALGSKGDKRPPPSGYKGIEYLIATVPDPKDTRLDHQFDRTLDAIRRGVESAEFNFDRFWLPWDRGRTSPPPVSPSDPKMTQTANRHLRDPGVILFRNFRKSGSKRLLLLFLVGETQTGGIHKAAFQNALKQIHELPHQVGSTTGAIADKEPLRVLGPYFSGSADSLAILIKEWKGQQESPPDVRIITGSTGSIDKQRFLENNDLSDVILQGTEVNSWQATDEFYNYLKEWDRQLKPQEDGSSARAYIAVLSESGTGRGQSIRQKIRDMNRTAARDNQPLVLSMTYPVHISQLRVEASKNSPRDGATNAPAAKDSNLPLPMTDPGNSGSKDIAPLFSPLETVTMELALREILTTIHRERIRYVRVSATDPQDRIFLVREIRKHCPNATIFTQSADLLYLHSESNFDFQGARVISSYPLFALNQLWTYPFEGERRRLQFPTPMEEGIYNATLALLNKEDRMVEYGYPFKTYADGEKRYPALWLSIVGRNGIWPVKAFDCPPNAKSYTLSIDTKQEADSPILEPRLGLSGNYRSPTGVGFLLLLGAICLFLALSILAQLSFFDRDDSDRLRFPAWIKRGLLGQVFGDEKFYCYRQNRRINLIGCCGVLLTVSLFTSGVAILPALALWSEKNSGMNPLGWNRHLGIGVVACTILVLTLAAFVWVMVNIGVWIISGWRHFRGRAWVVLGLVAGGAIITFVVWGLVEILFQFKTPEKVFFFLRATELSSGVSILLPALLISLAAFLSFFAALRRLNLAERMPCLRKPRQRPDAAPQFLNFDHENAKSFEGLKALENRVKEMIVSPIFKVPGVTILTISIIVIYWHFFQKNFIPSVDGPRFDHFFEMAFCLVPLLLVWAMMRFFWLWVAVKRMLRRLSWHPLISQYAARHSEEKRFTSLPPIDLMTHTPTYTALSISVRRARSFYNSLRLGPGQAGDRKHIGQLVEEAESELSSAFGAEATGDWRMALRHRRYSQAALAELTESVTSLLEGSWQAAGPDAEWRDEGKYFLITHVVAFLQHIFAQLQNLVGLVTIGLLLMLLAAISYPFQPREPLLMFSWVAILTSVIVTLLIFLSANRDKTLSLLAGKAPGKLNVTRDLVFRVLVHGVAPLVALLGVQFPEAVRQIFSWLNVFEGKGN